MLEHSIYAVLTPEGFASILWKDASRAKEAAAVMKITSKNLKDFNIIDGIIKEPRGGAHKNPVKTTEVLKKTIIDSLLELKEKDLNELIDNRYNKFRAMGNFY